MSVEVSYKKQFLLGIFFIILVFFIVEGFAYVFELFNPSCSFPNKDAFDKINIFQIYHMCLDHNKLLHYVDTILLLEPNQHYPTININSYGFRGSEITLEKPDNTFRIFIVGGSTTFGTAATSDQNTIPGFLQTKFDLSETSKNIEVINAGIGGADSARELYYVNKILEKFDPDMYIIYDGYNDAVRELEYGEFGTERVDVLGSAQSKKDTFKFSNYPEYRTPFVIHNILFSQNDPWELDRYVNSEDMYEKVELWKNRWGQFCEVSDIPTTIIVHPVHGSSNKKLSPDEERMLSEAFYHETILKTVDLMANELTNLEKSCSKTLDLRNVFDNMSEPIFYDLVHVNDLGNEIIAEEIFSEIHPLVLNDLT